MPPPASLTSAETLACLMVLDDGAFLGATFFGDGALAAFLAAAFLAGAFLAAAFLAGDFLAAAFLAAAFLAGDFLAEAFFVEVLFFIAMRWFVGSLT
ncbi:MAG: hypothetical protein CMI32_03695 [Opitutales bacterium]|nr:hypothetical protein [Opitutales bacterium]